jgi:putative Holliday junction resolvase
MNRYLGIDYGSRRIGLAIGDSLTRIATPIALVAARGSMEDHARSVMAAADEFDFDQFVVGLPLNMDGSEGEQSRIARGFGRRLAALSAKPVAFHDERLSSRSADDALRDAGVSRRAGKSQRDAMAARDMLQDYLDRLPAS